jgi:hypothetical protein
MIKKIIWISVIVLVIFAVWFLISSLFRSNKTELYILQETHMILYDEEAQLTVHYFTNHEDFKFIDSDTVVFLQNDDSTFKFPIDYIHVKPYHNEVYFDTLYYGYELSFKLPELTGNYHLNKAYLYFERDNKQVRYSLGELYVEYLEDYHMYPFTSLEGIKKNTPHLSQIIVDSNNIMSPYKVYIGPYEASFFHSDEMLVVNIPTVIRYLFSNTYVKVLIDNETYIVPQFNYFRNYEQLESGFVEKYTI